MYLQRWIESRENLMMKKGTMLKKYKWVVMRTKRNQKRKRTMKTDKVLRSSLTTLSMLT